MVILGETYIIASPGILWDLKLKQIEKAEAIPGANTFFFL